MSYQFDEKAYRERIRWFQEARFGMFLHFGLYALPGRGEWVHSDYPDVCFLDLGENPTLPDPVDTVVKIVLQDSAETLF